MIFDDWLQQFTNSKGQSDATVVINMFTVTFLWIGIMWPTFQASGSAEVWIDFKLVNKIVRELHNLDPNKSVGPDNWPTRVLKDMADQMCSPLYT